MARARTSQTSLAKRLNISQQSLSRRITGEIAFDVAEIERIATELGVPVAQLVGESAVAS